MYHWYELHYVNQHFYNLNKGLVFNNSLCASCAACIKGLTCLVSGYPLVIFKWQEGESEQGLFYLLLVVPRAALKLTVTFMHEFRPSTLARHMTKRFNIYSKRAAFNVCTSQAHGQCQFTIHLVDSIFCQVSSILSVL